MPLQNDFLRLGQRILLPQHDQVIALNHDVGQLRVEARDQFRRLPSEMRQHETRLQVDCSRPVRHGWHPNNLLFKMGIADRRTDRVGIGVLVPDYHQWLFLYGQVWLSRALPYAVQPAPATQFGHKRQREKPPVIDRAHPRMDSLGGGFDREARMNRAYLSTGKSDAHSVSTE